MYTKTQDTVPKGYGRDKGPTYPGHRTYKGNQMTLFKCDDNQRYDDENSSCYFHESELICLGCEYEKIKAENEALKGLVKSLTSLSTQLTDQLLKGNL